MVNIAIAGGTGQLARAVTAALLSINTPQHAIHIFTRSPTPPPSSSSHITYHTTDYSPPSLTSLITHLKIHTLLSFIQPLSDPSGIIQITLINACIAAGVTRFAPSEYGPASISETHLPFWKGKVLVREYLREVNIRKKVLEYTFFTPGLLMDYLATPYRSSQYITPLGTVFDFENRRAVVVKGYEEAVVCFTTAEDVARGVAGMVGRKERWEEVSGMVGGRVTFREMVGMMERLRGRVEVTEVEVEDLRRGLLEVDWGLERKHEAVGEREAEEMKRVVMVGMLLGCVEGAWDVSDEVDKALPEMHFEGVDAFMKRIWEGKP